MSRTHRDVRRAKYRRFVERWFPNDDIDRHPDEHPRDLLVEQGDKFSRDYLPHVCSPYCLIHWAKRVDRRKARFQAKRWLREQKYLEDERDGGSEDLHPE